MNHPNRAKPPQTDFLKEGSEAFLAGRFYLAAQAFSKAQMADPRNPVPLFNLASAKERLGDIDEAAVQLTRALRLRPGWLEPAQRLSLLCARYVLTSPQDLNPHGLLAAFAFDQIDQQPLAAAAFAYLRGHTSLGEAVRRAQDGQADEAARDLLLRRTDKVLTHPLFQQALTREVNHNPELEKLFTSLRRVMLMELPPERFADKALLSFAIALCEQCINNEHVFATSAEEREMLTQIEVDWTALKAGDPRQMRHLLLQLLYAPPHMVVGDQMCLECGRKLRPRALMDLVWQRFEEDRTLTTLAAEIPNIGAVQDGTGLKVTEQYEAYPYPRWRSVQLPPANSARRMLERFVAPEQLSFMDHPHKVLIAGSGTGRHALAVAVRYGENSDVLAVDLSRRSLAYGKMKAAHYGIKNLRFAQADINTIDTAGETFDIIETVGVLHHMQDLFAGWSALLKLLRPGGLMLTGLYSAISRRNITALRSEPDYPGPACDDDAAREFRAKLMDREVEKDMGDLTQSHDFYTLSNFRDLVLHEHERPVTLPEIDNFMQQNALIFRGFVMPQAIEAQFLAAFPNDGLPGALSNWAAFEETHPRAFDGMYQFWCEKGPSG